MNQYSDNVYETMVFMPDYEFRKENSNYFHWHSKAEFLYFFCDDEFEIVVEGIHYKPKKGDLIYIGEYATHYFVCESDCAHMWLGQFTPSLILGEKKSSKLIKTYITADEIASDPIFEKRLKFLFELMKTVGKDESRKKDIFDKNVFLAFYFILAQKFPQSEQISYSKKGRKDFFNVIEYVNNNLDTDMTITSIAKELYLDRGRLAKIFLQYAGVSINDYINNIRISNVNEMLSRGHSITEAAYENGYKSIRTFNSVYKRVTNITPTQYLKQLSEKNKKPTQDIF